MGINSYRTDDEDISDLLNQAVEEKTGSDILEILDNGKEKGKEILEKTIKAGKTGLVATGLLGMSLLGTGISTQQAEAYPGETGNLVDRETAKEIEDIEISFPDFSLRTGMVSGYIGIENDIRESYLKDGHYGFTNGSKIELSIKGQENGSPYMSLSRTSSTFEIDDETEYSIQNQEETSVTQVSAGIMLGENSFNKIYGFSKNISARNELDTGWPDNQSSFEKYDKNITGAGVKIVETVGEGLLLLEGEISRSPEMQEDSGTEGRIAYRTEENYLEGSFDRSLENQELGKNNQKSFTVGHELGDDDVSILPYIEIGDKFNRYGVKAEQNDFFKMEFEAGMKEYDEDGETGFYIRFGGGF